MSDFVKEIHNMFDHIWDCEIDHPVYQDTVGELMEAVIQTYEKHKPTLGTNLAEVGKDCISRQQAIDALCGELCGGHHDCEFYPTCNEIHTIIELPSIQPKRGKWIKTARWGRVYYCNQCRNYLDFDGVNAGRGSTNFCPNCGADMRGEQDDSV